MIFEKFVKNMEKELTRLKTIRQRSAAAIQTMDKSATASIAVDSTGYGLAVYHLHNISGGFMMVDLVFDFNNFKQKFGDIYTWADFLLLQDSENPEDYYLHININSASDSVIGKTVEIPFTVMATANFTLEVYNG